MILLKDSMQIFEMTLTMLFVYVNTSHDDGNLLFCWCGAKILEFRFYVSFHYDDYNDVTHYWLKGYTTFIRFK